MMLGSLDPKINSYNVADTDTNTTNYTQNSKFRLAQTAMTFENGSYAKQFLFQEMLERNNPIDSYNTLDEPIKKLWTSMLISNLLLHTKKLKTQVKLELFLKVLTH